MAAITFEGLEFETETVPCDLCGGVDFRPFWKRMRHGYNLPTEVCVGCGLFQSRPRFTHAANARFYDRLYPRFHGRSDFNDKAWIAKSKRMAVRRLELLHGQKDFAAKLRVLEIGCGAGEFLHALKSATHWNGTGLEAGDAQIRRCHSLGLDVKKGLWEDFNESGPYDLIASFHVLEHALSPTGFLEKARRLLSPDGMLYVEVPDLEHPQGRFSGFFQLPHIFSFSQLTLNNLLLKVGFSVRFVSQRSGNLSVVAVKSEPRPVASLVRFDIESFCQHLVHLDRVKMLGAAIPKVPLLSKIRGTLESI